MRILKNMYIFHFLVSNALPRENTEDVELGGYLLPKGTMIIPEIRSIHMDPNEWPEPEVFRPERWIDDAGKVRKSDSFMPFSAGLHSNTPGGHLYHN